VAWATLVVQGALVHPPQWFGSVFRFVSQPLYVLPSQFPNPVLQVAVMHTPDKQAAVACCSEQT
jgi:hypothetical protein